MAKVFLAIPATSGSSERMWSRSGKILSANSVSLKPNVTSATIFVAESAEVLRKHYDEVVKGVNYLTPLYLPEAWKKDSAADVDVGQDLF